MKRVPYEEMVAQFARVLEKKGFTASDAQDAAIIFAQNKRHAEFIRERFGKLYPQLETQYPGFIQRVVCDDAYAQSIIDDFKQPDKPPFIAVSVDMMDTGIDVPECVNLVFFKKVRSKTKFWQMIGRGTRLCPDLMDGEDKDKFYIFDFCNNFEFFRICLLYTSPSPRDTR